jgi:hypothetical protein
MQAAIILMGGRLLKKWIFDMKEYSYGTGRRKTSAARVFVSKGTGQISVNAKSLEDFFRKRNFSDGGSSTTRGCWIN